MMGYCLVDGTKITELTVVKQSVYEKVAIITIQMMTLTMTDKHFFRETECPLYFRVVRFIKDILDAFNVLLFFGVAKECSKTVKSI